MKDWEPHRCKCGLRLINLRGMPHFGIIWAKDEDDFSKTLRQKQPQHDVYIYKIESVELIQGMCRH